MVVVSSVSRNGIWVVPIPFFYTVKGARWQIKIGCPSKPNLGRERDLMGNVGNQSDKVEGFCFLEKQKSVCAALISWDYYADTTR
jgi:hypothetical protein